MFWAISRIASDECQILAVLLRFNAVFFGGDVCSDQSTIFLRGDYGDGRAGFQ